jgi:hypothetical protein
MNSLINAALAQIWSDIATLKHLQTPDIQKGKVFTVISVVPESVTISSEAGSSITLRKAAFMETLRYLIVNGHNADNPCVIGSNQNADDAGPLCVASRSANGNTRVISYIVPILAALGILGVSGDRPNKTWLL